MYNEQAHPAITGASFIENRAFLDSADDDLGGGGMYNYKSSPILEDCLFAGNSVAASTCDGGDGGAIFCDQSSPTLVNCVILANTARRSGGGMTSRWGGTAVGGLLVNCLFNANSAGNKGGGLNILDDTVRLTNCTFSANSGTSGGGIYSQSAEPVLVNCILQGNRDNGGNVENAQILTVGGAPAIDYSCVEGWSGLLGGTGNIGSDAHFADADGADDIAGTEDDDLRISAGSLCIDAGDNAALPPFVITDLDGNPRIIRDVVDMGAYEFAGMLRWYVDGVNGDDNNSGLSPDSAFATIQKGINSAIDGYTVVVLPGVYQEDVYFNGKAITVMGQGSDATILESPNGYAVTFQHAEDANSVLRNVVIRNCYKYAGILVWGCSPTITNVTVVGNKVGLSKPGWGNPNISNSIFWNNINADLTCEVSCGAVTYSCIQRGLAGEGNISADPLFADLAGGDYHLLSQRGRHRPTTSEWVLDDVTSPCVDAGDPSVNPSEERMPNGGRLNMGAFGGTYYASMSEWPLAGDINRDGVINLKDFALVAENWLSAMEWAE
jgi:predicted outer membrane repeat protein